jgi:hypothetical protein
VDDGRVINISTSVVGFYHPNFGVYAATKPGVDAMTHRRRKLVAALAAQHSITRARFWAAFY